MRSIGRLGAAVVVGGLLLGAAIAALWFGLLGGGLLQRAPIEGLTPREGEPDRTLELATADELPATMNVLVAGSDSRAGLSNGQDRGARPDTIMIVQMRDDGTDAALLSLPRDLRVQQCDGGVGRINEAFAVAARLGSEGGSCLVQVTTEVTGIPIHHYVEMDMAGFIDVVDTIGGVEMCFDRAMPSHGLDAGCQRLDGATALSYVRDRSLDGTGDFGRIERQQQFVKAVAEEVTEGGFAASMGNMARTGRQIRAHLTTDEDLDLRMLTALANAFRDIDANEIVGTTVPADHRMMSGVAYVIMREDEAEEIFAAFREGHGYDHLVGASAASED